MSRTDFLFVRIRESRILSNINAHKNARMMQFHTESHQLKDLMSHNEDMSLVTEAEEILLSDDINKPNTSKEILAQYLNELVREAFDDLKTITFKVGNN